MFLFSWLVNPRSKIGPEASRSSRPFFRTCADWQLLWLSPWNPLCAIAEIWCLLMCSCWPIDPSLFLGEKPWEMVFRCFLRGWSHLLDQSAVLRTPEDARAPFAPFAHPNLPCGVTKPDWGVLIGFNHDLTISSREMSWMHGITINHDKSPGGICVHLRNWQPGIQLFAFSGYPIRSGSSREAAKPSVSTSKGLADVLWTHPWTQDWFDSPRNSDSVLGLFILVPLFGEYYVLYIYIYIYNAIHIYIYDKYVIYNYNIYICIYTNINQILYINMSVCVFFFRGNRIIHGLKITIACLTI